METYGEGCLMNGGDLVRMQGILSLLFEYQTWDKDNVRAAGDEHSEHERNGRPYRVFKSLKGYKHKRRS